MKHFILFISLFLVIGSQAQNAKYISLMEQAIATMDTCTKLESLQNVTNLFERIADKEQGEWLPKYYLAYCNSRMAYLVKKNAVDDYCDKAEVYITKADSLSPNNSEIYVVKAMMNSARIMVNPASRGSKYGGIAGGLLNKAKTLDESNPRVYLQQGMGMFYTPKMFGGGKDKALPLFETATTKFSTFKPASTIAPNWGAALSIMMADRCK